MPYASPVARHSRVEKHKYLNASEDMAASLADIEGLQAVTAAFICTQPEVVDNDLSFWVFSQSGYEYGTGHWMLGEGVDPRTNGEGVDIWLASGRCIGEQQPYTRVFMRKADLEKIGVDLPEPAEGSPEGMKAAMLRAKEMRKAWRHRIDEVPAVGTDVTIRLKSTGAVRVVKTRPAAEPDLRITGGEIEYVDPTTGDVIKAIDMVEWHEGWES